jgi:hypothetical protein
MPGVCPSVLITHSSGNSGQHMLWRHLRGMLLTSLYCWSADVFVDTCYPVSWFLHCDLHDNQMSRPLLDRTLPVCVLHQHQWDYMFTELYWSYWLMPSERGASGAHHRTVVSDCCTVNDQHHFTASNPCWTVGFLPDVWSSLQASVNLCGVFCLPWHRHSGTRDHGL